MNTDHRSLFVGSRWRPPHGEERITVRSASTQEVIGSVPRAEEADVDAAVDAARRAVDDPSGWSRWEPARRAEVLRRLADEYDARAEDIVTAIAQQSGMPITFARLAESSPSAVYRWYADLVSAQPTEEVRDGVMIASVTVQRTPVGVVAAIIPWNSAQSLTSAKLAPALAAGCAVVLKPAPEAALDAFLLAEAAEAAGVPAGVLSILPGGRGLGAHLVSHPGVDRVAFTGSTEGGRAVARACAALLRPVSLELGGKSAAVVLDDADLDPGRVGQSLFAATLANNGQVCFLSTRVLAPRSRYEEVVEVFAQIVSGAVVGDALEESTTIGPLVSRAQRDRVAGYIARGAADGARTVVGGPGVPQGLDRGWFVRPTLFADVDNDAVVAREEIFGPVLAVIGYDDEADAVRLANDSDFGLAGTVWSADPERATRVASALRTGTVGINGYVPDLAGPYGGVKASGIGHEFGPEGLAAYQDLKSVYRTS